MVMRLSALAIHDDPVFRFFVQYRLAATSNEVVDLT